jgi:hypothetical protein
MLLLALLLETQAQQHVDKARAAIELLRYDRALEELDAALRAGDSDPKGVATILRMLGEVNASLDLPETAVQHFQRLLALDPTATLGDVSPKIAQPFADARAAGRPPLRAHAEIVQAPVPAIVVIVDSDPLSMAAGARATADGRHLEARGASRIELPLPPAERLELQVSLLDRYGNRLIDLPELFYRKLQPPERSHAYLWTLAAGGAAAITGIVFGLASRSNDDDARRFTADSTNHDYREIQSLQDSARHDALAANISFGVAGACAIVAAYLYWRSPAETPVSASRSGVTVGLHF